MRKSREKTSATKTEEDRDKEEEEEVEGVGHGELYSPDYAIEIPKASETANDSRIRNRDSGDSREEGRNDSIKDNSSGKMMAVNLRGIKEKVLEKLAAASVPSDALDNARMFLEGVVRDFAVAAQGMTKDALHRIKTHLVVILPSLSPAVTRKMVDDAEKESNTEEEKDEDELKIDSEKNQSMGKSATFMTPASSLFASLAKPFSRL